MMGIMYVYSIIIDLNPNGLIYGSGFYCNRYVRKRFTHKNNKHWSSQCQLLSVTINLSINNKKLI